MVEMKRNKKRHGRSPSSLSNVCTGCNKDLGGNITKGDINSHKCKTNGGN
jgi:hypothetical protein